LANEQKVDGRKSPENIARLKEQGFKKGMQRHPDAGRKKEVQISDYVKGLMSQNAEEAVQTILHLMQNAEKESVRLDAAKAFIAPFVAKAPKQINVEHNLGVSDLLQRVNSRRNAEQDMIDITPDDGKE